MRRRNLLAVLFVLVLCQMAVRCPVPLPGIEIHSPPHWVDGFDFVVEIELIGEFEPGSLEVSINHESILDRLSGGPLYSGVIEPGSPLRDFNLLLVQARDAADGRRIRRAQFFAYLPPGKARARRIRRSRDLIRGPLAHSKIGDYLLENGEARFVIQDVGQRELYSVGQYGGNLIDAELVGNPGKDNFLELQPGLNIETVINAQTVEILNDGQDGTAAQILTCGPDDLLDFVNASSQVTDLGLPFPTLADDFDLEIEGCTTYGLEPGNSYVQLDTEVFNNQTLATIPPEVPADGSLPLYVGDWLNPAGALDTFARPMTPPGFLELTANGLGPPASSNLGTLGFFGFDEAAGTDYAYTLVPLAPPSPSANATFVYISGVLVVLHSQSILATMIGIDPVRFVVPLGGSLTYTRFVGVGDGSASSAVDLENAVRGTTSGELEGCVSVAGAPVAGAKVSVGSPLLTASDKIASNFVTRPGPCPNYAGTLLVGSYQGAAGLEGHLYEGGAGVPPLKDVTITSGTPATLNFDLPATGSLRVDVTDESGSPVPARVTVVGFDPSPEPLVAGPSLPGFGGGPLGLLNDVDDAFSFGITAVGFANETGTTEFDLEPGVDLYHVFVSRGTEYSAYRTPTPISVSAGSQTVVSAQIARVVETSGFISSDFHVHGIRSADSRVSDVHRVESYTAEGVENVIMTDHHVHTDLRPAIAAAGMESFVTATIGEEITTFDYGHFNAYPLLIDPDSPHGTFSLDGLTQLSGGATDWAQAAPPGEDFPIYGALNATPAEILSLATTGSLSIPGTTTAQINHIGSHFAPLKIDTLQVPPADLMSDDDRAKRRLPDTAAAPNLFAHFPALELWNGNDRGHQSEFLDERIGIWFNHLNQGLRTTFIADTDSHRFANLRSAGARTWTASPADSVASFDPADLAASVEAGRAVGGQGVFVTTRLMATDGFGDVADLTWGGDTTMSDAGGDVVLEIDVQSPAWAEWDTIEVYANATTFTAGSPYLFGAAPTLALQEGDCNPLTTGDGDFDVTLTEDVAGVPGADSWSATLEVPFDDLAEETWFVVVVKGSDGLCAPMFPIYPDDLSKGSNPELGDLVDGNVGEGGVMALGATNALYFEP
ncbi:MAG: hypothetical protein JRS35_05605 [Deltaproteobacteria bacterium]|nr:hypothetical protein [Deltaproteobacteria bacterium]